MRISFLFELASYSLVVSACNQVDLAGPPPDAAPGSQGGLAAPGSNVPPADAGLDTSLSDPMMTFPPFAFAGDAGATSTSIALPSTGGPASAADGWILFDSDADGLVPHLFAVRPDGSGLMQITSGTWADTEPAVSPDGRTIAFTSTRAGIAQIFSLDVATKAVTQLTTLANPAGDAAFSPDGKTIAFDDADGTWLMNADGTSAHSAIPQAIQANGIRIDYEAPAFAQNGTQLFVDMSNGIVAFGLSGKQLGYVIEPTTAEIRQPVLSRDGASLAFIADPCEYAVPFGLVLVASASSSDFDRCAARPANFPNLGALSHPSWGPRSLITFAHVSSVGLHRIVVTDASRLTAQPVEIVHDNGNQQHPTWAPSTFSPPAP